MVEDVPISSTNKCCPHGGFQSANSWIRKIIAQSLASDEAPLCNATDLDPPSIEIHEH